MAIIAATSASVEGRMSMVETRSDMGSPALLPSGGLRLRRGGGNLTIVGLIIDGLVEALWTSIRSRGRVTHLREETWNPIFKPSIAGSATSPRPMTRRWDAS